MARVDLDAARAARAAKREAAGEVLVVAFGGRDYTLAPELPVRFVELLGRDQLEAALGLLLADVDDVDPFLSNSPTLEDLTELAQAYGINLGESVASRRSSNGTSRPSRPTSNRTTDSTSGRSAGGKRTSK